MFAGVRILGDFAITDSEEAQALTWKLPYIHIYSNSWGPVDGTCFTEPGVVTKKAFVDGITMVSNNTNNIIRVHIQAQLTFSRQSKYNPTVLL